MGRENSPAHKSPPQRKENGALARTSTPFIFGGLAEGTDSISREDIAKFKVIPDSRAIVKRVPLAAPFSHENREGTHT